MLVSFICWEFISINQIISASLVAQTVKCLPAMWATRKILWRREWQPTPVLLPGKFHAWRRLEGYSPWGRKESTWVTFFLSFSSMKSLHISCYMYTVRRSRTIPQGCTIVSWLFLPCLCIPSLPWLTAVSSVLCNLGKVMETGVCSHKQGTRGDLERFLCPRTPEGPLVSLLRGLV